MSQSSPVAQNDASLLIQQRLSARQAKRAAKAAERQNKSDALKEEGNAFFRDGNFLDALGRYQQAIAVHGPSAKPLLLTNLSAAYFKLGMYPEAHEAADTALTADPTSVKARYRRGMARKHLEMWTAAGIDFSTVLALDPENKDAKAKLAFVEEKLSNPLFWQEDEEVMDSYSDYEAPALQDDPELGESLSESSDCEHTGNSIPCKFYNHRECKNGHACRFSHAPDGKSERDALGRNVCRYYLMGICKFGDRCSYLHSKEHLLQKGWWSTTEGIDKETKRYNLIQMCNRAIADYNGQTKTSGKARVPKKKGAKAKKKRVNGSCSGFGRSGPVAVSKNPTFPSYSGRGGHDVYTEDDEGGMCGFTSSDVEELVSQGVKPWDDDAWDVLHALREW